MLKSEIELLVDSWWIGYSKVFKVTYSFADSDTLVILKKDENLFIVDLESSTTTLFKEFTKDEIIVNIGNNKLIYMPDLNPNSNYRYLRTGGCTCGAYATRNPEHHSYDCSLYRR